MGVEIEHKYLVKEGAWSPYTQGTLIRQGYLTTDKERTVRIRIHGEKGFVTIKGVTVGDSRAEYEYEIPLTDASQMLDNLCLKPLIEKTRYEEVHHDRFWEIDVFHGDNEGLIVAEIELTGSQDHYQIPSWCSVNVTTDFRFANSSLLRNPYKNW